MSLTTRIDYANMKTGGWFTASSVRQSDYLVDVFVQCWYSKQENYNNSKMLLSSVELRGN